MKNLILLPTLMIIFLSNVLGQEYTLFETIPDMSWQPTGVMVDEGDSIFIFSNGYASLWNESELAIGRFSSPAGLGTFRIAPAPTNLCPFCPPGSLIGKVGNNGDPFYVGEVARLLDSPYSGELFLGFNDDASGLFNNIGLFISIIYSGGYSGNNMTPNNDDALYFSSPNIAIHPNPTTNYITIEYTLNRRTDVKIELISELGQFVKSISDGFESRSVKHELDVTNIPNGNYFLRFNFSNRVINKKIAIVK